MVKLLLDHAQTEYIEINNICCERLTGFLYACKNGHIEVVKCILHASRANMIYFNIDQWQLKRGLELAHENGQTKIVTLLKKHEKSLIYANDVKQVSEDRVICAQRSSKRQKCAF